MVHVGDGISCWCLLCQDCQPTHLLMVVQYSFLSLLFFDSWWPLAASASCPGLTTSAIRAFKFWADLLILEGASFVASSSVEGDIKRPITSKRSISIISDQNPYLSTTADSHSHFSSQEPIDISTSYFAIIGTSA